MLLVKPLNIIVDISPLKKTIYGTSVFIRTMRKSIQKIVSEANPNNLREFATWGAFKRKALPKKTNPHPGDNGLNQDGKTELPVVDHSGYNHYLIGNINSAIGNENLDVHAIASTKNYPYKGVNPTKVSDITLENQNKPQYFHEKENTVIPKEAVSLDIPATAELQNRPELVQSLNKIQQDQNIT